MDHRTLVKPETVSAERNINGTHSLPHQGETTAYLKGTVSRISNDLSSKEGHLRFTMAPFKMKNTVVCLTQKMFNFSIACSGSPDYPNQNFRQIGTGVPEL